MRLTPDLIDYVHRDLEDPGPVPNVDHLNDEDYTAIADGLEARLHRDEPLRIFAYGSLIWKPEYEVRQSWVGQVYGRHRAFHMHIERFRGSRDVPGLMMGLERGGSCCGLVQELPVSGRRSFLEALIRREMITKPCTYAPRWLRVHGVNGTVSALAFVFDRNGHFYRSGLSKEDIAERLSKAVGHVGSNAEYLMNTNQGLANIGIKDRNLCELERLVAARIHARHCSLE